MECVYIEYYELQNNYRLYANSPLVYLDQKFVDTKFIYDARETVEELLIIGIETYGTVGYKGVLYDKTYLRKVKIDIIKQNIKNTL